MERKGIAQVQARVKEMAAKGWPLRVRFSNAWRIEHAGTSEALSPLGATAGDMWKWLDAVEVGARIRPSDPPAAAQAVSAKK